MIDQTISHYEILKKLGEGGMGVVYKAKDTKLDRTIALKFLPPHLTKSKKDKQRFIREAKSAAALNHPNICTIYSVDEYENRQFISMEYINGDTLKNRLKTEGLDVRSALEYTIQIAEALSKAQHKGIIHRDIKPGNIMLDPDGRIKVTDFGLAKISGSNSDSITKTGTTVGTVAYMSPEQIQAKEIDHRADLFSLGVVLFEMLTGERPFKGQYDAALTYAIANEDPPLLSELNPELPDELSRIVNRLLEKDPEDRYQSAEELASDLKIFREKLPESITSTSKKSEESSSTAPVSTPKSKIKNSSESGSTSITINLPPLRSGTAMAGLSAGLIVLLLLGYWLSPFTDSTEPTSENTIAVLPLESVSGDSADARFADGVHEELINRLAGIGDLTVIARSSVLGYEPGERDLQTIAQELEVSSLMEGTVRRADDQLRVSVQLINANNLGTQWSGSFEENVDDVFEIQSRIARQVAGELQASISTEERRRLENRPTDNPQAYRMYMQAREYLSQSKFYSENLVTSQELLNKAVDEDPGFAQAWAMLTVTHSYLYWLHDRTPERLDMVRKTAERAQELAPNQPETEIAVGMSLYWSETDNERTLSYFQTILQRFPNQTILHLYIALTHRRLGNWESVIEHLNNALELDPLNSNHYLELAWNFWLMRDYDEAQASLDKLRELKPNTSIPFSFEYRISVSRDGSLEIVEEYWNQLRPADLAIEDPLLWGLYNLIKRNWKEANRGYRNSEYEMIRSDEARYILRDYFIGLTFDRMGNQAEANRYYEEARNHLEKLTDEHPNEARYRTALGKLYARMGKDKKAIQEGEKATELTPFSQNANAGSYFEFQLAEIYAWTGHEEKAIDKLEFALSVPSYAHRNLIRLNPRWDPLRDNPRFQELIAEEDKPYLEDL